MREQDKLRNTLREYYDDQESSFDNSEWEQASAYLAMARKKRKVRVGAIILTTLLLGLSIFVMLYSDVSAEKINASTGAEKHNFPTAVTSPFTPPGKPDLSEKKAKVQRDSRSSQNEKNSSSTIKAVTIQAKSNPIEPGKSEDKNLAVFASPSAKLENTYTEPNTLSFNSPAISTSEKGQQNSMPEQKSFFNQNELPGAEDIKQSTDKETPLSLSTLDSSDARPLIAKLEVVENSPNENGKRDTAQTVTSSENLLPLLTDTLALMPIAESDMEFKGDSLNLPTFDNLTGDGLFYEAGASWLYGWKGPKNYEARGFSPLLGINYMNRVTNRSALSFGVYYVQAPKLSNSTKTSRISSYTYGEQSQVTVITPSTLHYLVAPLRFHYYFNKHNSIGGGVNLAYLLNVDANVTTYDEKPGVTENYKTVKLSGYTEGFSWFDAQLAIFYNRKLNHSLGLQLEIFMGLVDVKQDGFFNLNSKERNSGAKLSLIYYAFKRKHK